MKINKLTVAKANQFVFLRSISLFFIFTINYSLASNGKKPHHKADFKGLMPIALVVIRFKNGFKWRDWNFVFGIDRDLYFDWP